MRDVLQNSPELRFAIMCDGGRDTDPEGETTHESAGSTWCRLRRGVSTVRPSVWALPCAGFAVVYAVVGPASRMTSGTAAIGYLILRWGHSATWVLLAISFVVRSGTLHWRSLIANLLAVVALVAYAAFLFTAARTLIRR